MAKKYDINQRPGETTEHYYRRLAKVADQRLVRLEALSHETGFKNVKKWAYARAMKDIEHWTPGGKRFNTAMPKTQQGVDAKIADMRQFLEMQTTSKRDIMSTYKKRVDTINKKYGTSFTWETLGAFYESNLHNQLSKQYGSLTEVKMIGIIQKNEDAIVESMKSNENVNIKVSDKQLERTVNRALQATDLSWDDLI